MSSSSGHDSRSNSGHGGDEPDFEEASDIDEDEDSEPASVLNASGGRGGANRFFLPPDGERRGSGRVFAAFEVPEPPADGDPNAVDDDAEPLSFECLDTTWFWSVQNGTRSWLDLFEDAPLSVLELTSFPMPPFPAGAEPGDVAWFEFGYTYSDAADANGRIYTSLYGTGDPVKISYYEPRSLDWAGSGPMGRNGWLAGACDLGAQRGPLSDATALQRQARKFGKSFGVAAYDVGQGNCQALIHENGHQPLMYVDLGGGVLFNASTFPTSHRGFCFSTEPLIVLSHWDWDHWSSAYRFPRSLDMEWLAPPIPQKPIQQTFAADLYTRGRLRIWDDSWPSEIKGGGVRIERCTGRTSNDSGLAVTLYSRSSSGRNCLFPGDADYRFIPSVANSERFSALCMTHHGGRLHSVAYPLPKRGPAALLSAGPRNSYRHPLLSALAAHLRAGWPLPVQTGFSGQRPCHVLLPWGVQPHLFHGDCPIGECGTAVVEIVPSHSSMTMIEPTPRSARKRMSRSKTPTGVL